MRVAIVPHLRGNPYQRLLGRALRSVGNEVSLLEAGRTLSGTIGGETPDVLHLHWIHPFLGGTNPISSRLRSGRLLRDLVDLEAKGVGTVWTVHNISSHEGRSDLEMDTRRSIATRVDAIVVHSTSIAKAVAREYGIDTAKVTVIRHGNYIGVHPNEVDREEARRRLGIGIDRRVFLFFGFIRPYKGLEELVEVFRRDWRRDDLLVIAGRALDDRVGRHIGRLCEGMDNVDLHLGYVDDNDVQVFMNAADFLVLPFRRMLTSGSIVLGASFSKPMIAPRFGFVDEVLDDEGSIVFARDDPDGLASSIDRAASMPREKVVDMGMHNRTLVADDTWESVAASTTEVYRSTLG